MKATELAAILADLIEKHGDADVVVFSEVGETKAQNVDYVKEQEKSGKLTNADVLIESHFLIT